MLQILLPYIPNIESLLLDLHSFDSLRELEIGFMKIEENIVNAITMEHMLHILRCLTNDEEEMKWIGKLWVSLSIAFLHSYIPDLPWDPVDMRLEECKYLDKEIDHLSASLLINQEYHFIMTGNQFNNYNTQVTLKIEILLKKKAELMLNLPLRPAEKQMEDIFQDLKRLKDHILSIIPIFELIDNIINVDEMAHAKETAFQKLLGAFIDKVKTKYPLYQDILEPVVLSIYQLRYGLRMCLIEAENLPSNDVSILENILNFTNQLDLKLMSNRYKLIDAMYTPTSELISIKLNMKLSILRQTISIQYVGYPMKEEVLFFISKIFSSITLLRNREQEQIEQEEIEKASLFKVEHHKFATEEEEEENELKKLFPDFLIDFDDLNKHEDLSMKIDGSPSASIKVFDSYTCGAISNAFFSFIQSLEMCMADSFGGAWSDAYIASFETAAALQKVKLCSLGLKFDNMGQSGFLVVAKDRLKTIENPLVITEENYDFYNDSNINEACKVIDVLNNYSKKLETCLLKWPEHSVLQNLKTICHRIISFPITSPIMKLLTGLELLLIKSDDWQKWASKEFSLKDSMDLIISLIVRWRKLELNSWNQLLSLECTKAKKRSTELWFHLWSNIYEHLWVADSSAFSSTISDDILSCLNDFCLQSTIGEFEMRLEMLRCFHSLLTHTKLNTHQSNNLQRIVWNVHAYYKQYIVLIQSKLHDIEKPIAKELKEYVKIATWYYYILIFRKDVNVFALKESAKRTHYQLNKFVKKFRLELSLSVKEVMLVYHEKLALVGDKKPNFSHIRETVIKLTGVRIAPNSFVKRPDLIDMILSTNSRLLKLQSHLATAESIATAILTDKNAFKPAINIEEISEAILDRIGGFQTFNDGKPGKGQKMIRKKAWVDLLKHLSYIGLSPWCSQMYQMQENPSYLNSQPEIAFSQIAQTFNNFAGIDYDIGLVCSKSESYFQRSLSRIAVVRMLVTTVSSDISRVEVGKAISYLDNLIHIALNERRVLSEYSTELDLLCSIIKQVRKCDFEHLSNDNFKKIDYHHLSSTCESINSIYVALVQARLVVSSNSLIDSEIMSDLTEKESKALRLKKAHDSLMLRYNPAVFSHISCPSLILSIENISDFAKHVYNDLEEQCRKYPEFSFMLENIVSVSKSCHRKRRDGTIVGKPPNESYSDFVLSLELCLDKTLLCIQHFKKNDNLDISSVDEFGIPAGQLVCCHKELSGYFERHHLESLINAMKNVFLNLGSLDDLYFNEGTCLLLKTFPIFEQCVRIVQLRLSEFVVFHKVSIEF
jgi:midasin